MAHMTGEKKITRWGKPVRTSFQSLWKVQYDKGWTISTGQTVRFCFRPGPGFRNRPVRNLKVRDLCLRERQTAPMVYRKQTSAWLTLIFCVLGQWILFNIARNCAMCKILHKKRETHENKYQNNLFNLLEGIWNPYYGSPTEFWHFHHQMCYQPFKSTSNHGAKDKIRWSPNQCHFLPVRS